MARIVVALLPLLAAAAFGAPVETERFLDDAVGDIGNLAQANVDFFKEKGLNDHKLHWINIKWH